MTYISDHAVLRYLERVKGIDIEAVQAEMLSPAVEMAPTIGCETVIHGSGARFKFHGDIVATVLPKRSKR